MQGQAQTLQHGRRAGIHGAGLDFAGLLPTRVAAQRGSEGSDIGKHRTAGGYLLDQKNAGNREQQVGGPYANTRRKAAVAGQRRSQQRGEVVQKNQQKREREGCAFAAALGTQAQRNTDQHEHQAGRGVGEASMELDTIGLRMRCRRRLRCAVGASPEGAGGHGLNRRIAPREVLGILLLSALDGQVGGVEGGNVVLAGVFGGEVVTGAIGQLQVKCLPATAEDDGLLRRDDVRRGLLRQIGQKDVFPERGPVRPRKDILHIENVVFQVFIEHTRLYLECGLRGLARLFIAQQRGGGAGGNVK